MKHEYTSIAKLQDTLLQALCIRYGTDIEEIAFSALFLRACTVYGTDELDLELKLPNYLVKELNLPSIEGRIQFEGTFFSINDFSESEDSISGILKYWLETFLSTYTTYKGNVIIKKERLLMLFGEIEKEVKSKLKEPKRSPNYHKIRERMMFSIINKRLNLSPIPPEPIDGIYYPPEHPPFSLDISDFNEDLTDIKNLSQNSITESTLEEFLFSNLDCIESGLKPIARQMKVSGGRIDILAEDKKKNLVILELKISSNPVDLLWQAVYYPLAIKRKFYNRKIRMMTVVPYLEPHILEPLLEVGNVEIVYYKSHVINNEIKRLSCSRPVKL